MRTMPSAMLRMVPWVRTSGARSAFWIRSLMRAVISVGFNCILYSTSANEVLPHFFEGAPEGSVIDQVSDLPHQPALDDEIDLGSGESAFF